MIKHTPYIINNPENEEPIPDFFYFPQVFKLREVEEIMKLGNTSKPTSSLLVDGRYTPQYRDSYSGWIPHNDETRWIYEKLKDVVIEANSFFNFNITHFGEPLQFTRYEEGNHFDWHTDLGSGLTKKRKLSIVVQLTDEFFYEGGDLQLFTHRDVPMCREKGCVIIFPSYKEHRVTPVKRGIRHSLVTWATGPSFR